MEKGKLQETLKQSKAKQNKAGRQSRVDRRGAGRKESKYATTQFHFYIFKKSKAKRQRQRQRQTRDNNSQNNIQYERNETKRNEIQAAAEKRTKGVKGETLAKWIGSTPFVARTLTALPTTGRTGIGPSP